MTVGEPFHDLGRSTLPPGLADLLHRVQQAERTARGAQRRPTFRFMRDVLGASIHLGVPVRLLAECLGTTPGSVRNRASRLDGLVAADLATELTGLTPAQLDRLSGGARSVARRGSGALGYPTIDLVRAVMCAPARNGDWSQSHAATAIVLP
jgi:hypothetical protein